MDFRLGRSGEHHNYWPVLSDVSISTLAIVLVLLAVRVVQTDRQAKTERALSALADSIQGQLAAAGVDTPSVSVRRVGAERQRIVFSSDLLFRQCRADLNGSGEQALIRVGGVLGLYRSQIESVEIEGHTDTVPVRQRAECPFRSNWELSSARATSVVRLLTDSGRVSGNQIGAVGRGQYRPFDGNPAAHAKNRRVEIVLIFDVDSAIAWRERLRETPP